MSKKKVFRWFGYKLIDVNEIESISIKEGGLSSEIYICLKSGNKYFIRSEDEDELAQESAENIVKSFVKGEII